MVNHPVHISDKNLNLLPSAFIPFCSLGPDMEILGDKIDNFSHPVCKIFKSKIFQGQTCYQLDLQDVQQNASFAKGAENALTFLMDYNEDKTINEPTLELGKQKLDDNSPDKALIYVDTLGRN